MAQRYVVVVTFASEGFSPEYIKLASRATRDRHDRVEFTTLYPKALVQMLERDHNARAWFEPETLEDFTARMERSRRPALQALRERELEAANAELAEELNAFYAAKDERRAFWDAQLDAA